MNKLIECDTQQQELYSERKDTVVVASVSCIYGIGSVQSYSSMAFKVSKGSVYEIEKLKRN